MTTVAFAHFIFCQVCHRMRSGMMRTGKQRCSRQALWIRIVSALPDIKSGRFSVSDDGRRAKGIRTRRQDDCFGFSQQAGKEHPAWVHFATDAPRINEKRSVCPRPGPRQLRFLLFLPVLSTTSCVPPKKISVFLRNSPALRRCPQQEAVV